jgi:D-aspartate ligase
LANKARALVVGIDCITGLQTARILARRGIPVIGLAADPHHFCCRTRAAERIVETELWGETLIQTLEDLARELTEQAVLFPCTDLAVQAISEHRQRLLPSFQMALPSEPTVELLMDKGRLAAYAQDTGLPIPATKLLRSRNDAVEASPLTPCIVKPSLKSPEWEAGDLTKLYWASDGDELVELYERLSGAADALIAQEWIEGGDSDLYTCNVYFDVASQPLVTFVTRKLRQWPPGAGMSSLGEECRNDTMLKETLRLFESAGLVGLGQLEMKRDPRTGNHYIIEANVGRPTGRSATAEAGGVELLCTMYCDLLGLPLPSHREQRYTGVKWIYWRKDLQSVARSLIRRNLTVGDWVRSLRGRKVDAVFSWSDPLPFWLDIWSTVHKTLDGGRRPSRLARPRSKTGDRTTGPSHNQRA